MLTATAVAADYEFRRWGNQLRVAAVLAIALFGLTFWLLLDDPGGSLAAIPLVLPYPYIAIVPRRKESLAWAQTLGWVYGVIFLWAAVLTLGTPDTLHVATKAFAITSAMVAVQGGAIYSARRVFKAGRALNRIAGNTVVSRVAAALFVSFWVFLYAVSFPGLVRSREAANEAFAAGTVRSINTAVATYRKEHGALPSRLSELNGLVRDEVACEQPPCTLAEYQIIYTVLTSDASGAHYSVVARPVKYRHHGTRSFYSDETGVIRFTTEDRAATAKDYPPQ